MRIAVFLDGSALAEQALEYALNLASPGDELLLMQNVHAWIADLALARAQEAAFRLRQLAQQAQNRGFACQTKVLCGRTIPSLLEALDETPVDLAVLCAPLRKGWLHRSVSRALANGAPCPVLVLRPGQNRTPRRALVALDGSEFAETALREACKWLKQRPAQLMLLGASGVPGADSEDLDYDYRRAMLARLKQYLAYQAHRLESDDLKVSWRAEDERPLEAILDWAERERADLIVLATHAREGLHRWMFPSVGRGLVDRSPRPVLLLNPRAVPAGTRA